MKIAVAGIGYVGLSNAIILSQHNEVVAYDIDQGKVDTLNERRSPIVDVDASEYLSIKQLKLSATTSAEEAFMDATYIIIATPTDYDAETRHFNTKLVEVIIEKALKINKTATIVIKSTVPVGYTEKIRERFQTKTILFSPEFLREGRALYDNLHPSRIIVGDTSPEARMFAELLGTGAIDPDPPTFFMQPTEAEAVKLFANTYLAMRVAYFNELDTYAELNELDARSIIDGVGADPRIGAFYNNPSFGYGGYCLPKDTKQLMANYERVPHDLITAIVNANETRIKHIAERIMALKPTVVGVYRLAMKMDSDNFRQSSIQAVIKMLREADIKVIIHEPSILLDTFESIPVIHDLVEFKKQADTIIANRISEELNDVSAKIYTRDIFSRD